MRKFRLYIRERVTYERIISAKDESDAEDRFMAMTPVGQQVRAIGKRREIMDIEVFEYEDDQ